MAKLELDFGSGSYFLELGEPDKYGEFTNGDLATFSGNLYLKVDGQEVGSVYLTQENGKLTATLGQYDPETGEWEERNPLHPLTDDEN